MFKEGDKNNEIVGKDLKDKTLIKEVRNLLLEEIKGILNKTIKVTDSFRNEMILRLGGQAIPRLVENTGEDGGPIEIRVKKYVIEDEDELDNQTNKDDKTNSTA